VAQFLKDFQNFPKGEFMTLCERQNKILIFYSNGNLQRSRNWVKSCGRANLPSDAT